MGTRASAGEGRRRVLILVENLPVPFDRRVWQEATTLRQAGYEVSVICPTGRGFERRRETIDGIEIYRYRLPLEADRALGYAIEYSAALFWQLLLTLRVHFSRGFDVIHACNPPDDIFLIALLFKPFGKQFVFDHHDVNPEMYEAKFGRRDLFYRLMLLLERWTYRAADFALSTNESYKRVAIERGRMAPERVFVVRSGPSLERMRIQPPNPTWKRGRRFLVGYVGVMGKQDGVDELIEIAALLVARGRKDIQFVLVGGGTELPALRTLVDDRNLSEFVTFTGRVPDEVLLDVLNTADVCVNPDPCTPMNDKSTMNKIVEYMALAKPIVQFDLTEGRASAQEASVYALCDDRGDFADKITELLDDPERRVRMGQFGRQRVETVLEWKFEAARLLDAYDHVFEAKAAREHSG